MKKRPIKVKRYKNTFSSTTDARRKALKLVVFLVILAVVFGGGFLFAKPVLDAASNFWYTVVKQQKTDDSSSEPLPEQTPQPTPETTPEVVQNPLETQGKWQFVNIAEISDVNSAQSKAKQLASEGVTHAVIKLKDTVGNIYYNSAIELAKPAIAANPIDAQKLASIFSENGVTPCAYISAFQDSIASYADRSMAVKYGDSADMLWLDTSVEFGGKPWLNPYNKQAQGYITQLADEIYKLGFSQIIVDKLQFPSGFGTNLCGYGADATNGRAAALAQTANALSDIAQSNNGYVWVMVPAEALSEASLLGYDESPFNIGIKNLWVKVTLSRTEDGTVVTNGGVTGEMLSDFEQKAKQNGTEHLAVYVADSVLDQALANSFYENGQDSYTQKLW